MIKEVGPDMDRLNMHYKMNPTDGAPKSGPSRPPAGALACVVNSEIGAVLAVMRRNVRWGLHFMVDTDQLEHSLIHSFKELRKQMFLWKHQWHTINPALYLQPFLDVIRSDETGAPITGIALSSVYKILSLDIIDIDTLNVENAMHLIVDAVTSCRFEVTDPSSEEVVLMKILQVLLACMKSKASPRLTNQHVCNIVNTCFRVVHQASSKGELLQRIARHTMHELVRCVFSCLPEIDPNEHTLANGSSSPVKQEAGGLENCNITFNDDGHVPSVGFASNAGTSSGEVVENNIEVSSGKEDSSHVMMEPYGIPCMVEIFHFLCSLLNVIEQIEVGPRSNPIAYEEDVPLFALGLINSAIEVAGFSFSQHPKLLSLIQDELFQNLIQFGLSTSPLILSTVCSIVLNLYYHLRTDLKLQLEAFYSCVLLRLAEGKHGTSYQQQEVAMEALVDLCRQKSFIAEMYSNFDCDVTCSNVFEDLVNLLSKNAFPVNSPLSAMHILSLEGLIAMIEGMADRVGNELLVPEISGDTEEYKAFWTVKCENYGEPNHWVPFVREKKYVKRKLMIGVDHFNRDPKKGLEYLQEIHLLPDKLDPYSVACFFRYTTGLDKNLVGDFLGNHDEFCVKVLHEFAGTFDFKDMALDNALRLFLETFRLPGESQKIQRVLEAFSERYYEQSPHILIDKDAALLLSYSLILLNTDQHNVQVKKKMTEEDFIRNNRHINGGADLPRKFLSELYHSICENEIRMVPDQSLGFPGMSRSRWIGLTHKSKTTTPFIVCESRALLDYDMFGLLSGPAIAAISVVFDHAQQEDVLQICIDGFLSVAKISSGYHLNGVLDDVVTSLCKFTTLSNPASIEEYIGFADDAKAKMATKAVFTVVNLFGDHIRSGWRNILDCILSLHKLGLLPEHQAHDAAGDLDPGADRPATRTIAPTRSISVPRKSSGLMDRFSQLWSLDTEEPVIQPTEEEIAARELALSTVQNFQIDNIFKESKFLHADSLLQLSQSLISVKAPGDEEAAIFCLELLVTITLNNRDRIMLLWQGVYEHISSIVQSTVMPSTLVEKAVFGLLRICQRLLPYKENLTDELLKSLQLVLKLDARVADAYCENITQEVKRLVKANAAHIRSHMGWRTITSLLSITARHPEASDSGFETLVFIMSNGAHLSPANFVLCVDAARQFAESRVGQAARSVSALELMAGSVDSLLKWSNETREAMNGEAAAKMAQDIGDMWLRLVQGLRKLCLDQREEVRNYAVLLLQKCSTRVDTIRLQNTMWLQCFDLVIFALLDDLLEITQKNSPKDYRNMEGTLVLAIQLMSKVFLQLLQDLCRFPSFCKLWIGILNRMERYMALKIRGKQSENIHELVPEILKNTLFVMKTGGILVRSDDIGADSFWQLTWLHVKKIAPSLEEEVFPSNELEAVASPKNFKTETNLVPSNETTA